MNSFSQLSRDISYIFSLIRMGRERSDPLSDQPERVLSSHAEQLHAFPEIAGIPDLKRCHAALSYAAGIAFEDDLRFQAVL